MTELPIITPDTCDGCGDCCMEQGSPPMYLYYLGDVPPEPDDEDWFRAKNLPTDALAILLDYRTRLMDGQVDHSSGGDPPCCWLNMETKACRFYDHRPQICRDFERGSDDCHNWRDGFGNS